MRSERPSAPPPSSFRAPVPPSTRGEVLAVIGILALVVGAVGGHKLLHARAPRATSAQCEAMLELYVEQLARAATPSPASSAIVAQKAEARALAARSPDFAECPSRVSSEQALCALGSDGADAFERCLLR